jgi:hypothetical protein
VGYCDCGEGGAFFDVPFDAREGGLLITDLDLIGLGGVVRGIYVRATELGKDLIEEGDTGDDAL